MIKETSHTQCTSAKCPGRERIIIDMGFFSPLQTKKKTVVQTHTHLGRKKNEGTRERPQMETLSMMAFEKTVMNYLL